MPVEIIIIVIEYILYTFSALTWTIIFSKTWQLYKNSINNRRFCESFENSSDFLSAQKLINQSIKGSYARTIQQGYQWLVEREQNSTHKLKYQGPLNKLLENTLRIHMHQENHTLENGLTWLASIGSTAPFIGLLGTVLGIMHALQQITKNASTSLDVVAGPIGDALIITAIGIAVAIPAVLAYNLFLRNIKRQRLDFESFITSFLYLATNSDAPG